MTQTILGHTVEFNEDTHTYLVDGVIVPNVSTILGATLYQGKYDAVDPLVLKRKAEWGSQLHKAIETDNVEGLDEVQFKRYDDWLGLQLQFDIKPLKHEQVVYYKVDDKVVYIGTFDLLARQLSSLILIDFKTTYSLDMEYLSWQLSFYKLAYEQMYGESIDGLFAIWLPKKHSGAFVPITETKSHEDVLGVIKQYEQIKGE